MLNILGPSGVGKGTIISKIISEFGNKIKFSTSHTTRKIREGEKDGINYYFINNENFQEMIEKDEFVEHVTYNGNSYGTSKNELINKYSNESVLILDLDIQGAIKLKKLDLKIDFIALVPPSFDILKERLIKRGTENIDQINKRIEIGKRELNEIENLDFIKFKIINNDFDNCYNEVRQIMLSIYPYLNS